MTNQNSIHQKGLSVKDLVTTGIFQRHLFCFYDDRRRIFCSQSGLNVLYADGQRASLRPCLPAAVSKGT